MNETLSVIVPIYNSEETLERCVTSILRQGLHDMEMILVDDGSTDSSPEMQKRDYSEKGENRQAYSTAKHSLGRSVLRPV